MMNEQDEVLVRRCLDGDRQAFSELIDKYQKAIFNVALRLTGDYDDARDVAQTVFIRVYERLRDYDPKFKFFSWIYKMTLNESLNRIDRRKRTTTLTETMESADRGPDERLEEKDMQEAVQDAIEELPIDGRVLLILRHFAELSYRELGYILDIPEKTVKSRLFSARQRLGEIIRKQGVIQYD